MNERRYIGSVTLRTKIRRALWNTACALLFRPFGTKLFAPWRNALLRLFGAHVESGATVYRSVRLYAPWMLRMESGACLGPGVVCYNQDLVSIGRDAVVSQDAYLCTAGHDTTMMNTADSSLVTAAITIGQGAWIGAGAFIGMGVIIGEEAVVGATASVFKDVEPRTIVGGNPARVIKKREMKTKHVIEQQKTNRGGYHNNLHARQNIVSTLRRSAA